MKILRPIGFLAKVLLVFAIGAFAGGKSVYVHGYIKSNGTYVAPHFRSAPDGNPYNNWSYPGNVNPYTGKVATGSPEAYMENYCNKSPNNSYCQDSYRGRSASYFQQGTESAPHVSSGEAKAPVVVENSREQLLLKPEGRIKLSENRRVCLSGEYPSLCDYSLLPVEDLPEVDKAERRANFRQCRSGDFPSLCKHELLSDSEQLIVSRAEHRANFRLCVSGDYPSLCNHSLLTTNESRQVREAELRANFRVCISGTYPSLCNHDLLSDRQQIAVADAEKLENFRICLSGYASLCKKDLLSPDELKLVNGVDR